MVKSIEILGNKDGRRCVFNCLDTGEGRTIAEEMLRWLEPVYEVHCVWHDGSRFEYEGLSYLKELVERTGEPALYVHTKGACNGRGYEGVCIRKMWEMEFGDYARSEEYFRVVGVERGVVASPTVDERRIPIYNGFVVNRAAMEAAVVEVSGDRFVYERLWCERADVDLRAMRYYGRWGDMGRFVLREYGRFCGLSLCPLDEEGAGRRMFCEAKLRQFR